MSASGNARIERILARAIEPSTEGVVGYQAVKRATQGVRGFDSDLPRSSGLSGLDAGDSVTSLGPVCDIEQKSDLPAPYMLQDLNTRVIRLAFA